MDGYQALFTDSVVAFGTNVLKRIAFGIVESYVVKHVEPITETLFLGVKSAFSAISWCLVFITRKVSTGLIAYFGLLESFPVAGKCIGYAVVAVVLYYVYVFLRPILLGGITMITRTAKYFLRIVIHHDFVEKKRQNILAFSYGIPTVPGSEIVVQLKAFHRNLPTVPGGEVVGIATVPPRSLVL